MENYITATAAGKILGYTNSTMANMRCNDIGPKWYKRGENKQSRVMYEEGEVRRYLNNILGVGQDDDS